MRAILLSTLFVAGLTFAAGAQTPQVTATCKDGSSFSGTSRRGACARHGGVQTFGAAATAAPATPSTPSTAPTRQQSTGSGARVWVNSASKVYHCQGDRYYGKTKAGSYMTETSAKAEGDRPSRGKSCS